MVCVGGAPQPTETNPDVIHVDEQYPTEEEPLPFDPKDVVNIRTNEKFEQFYDLDAEPIGEGKFGKVYRCVEKSTKLELAAKFIEIRKDYLGRPNDADRKQVEHEISVMTRLQHPRIAQIYDAFYSANNDVILVMELVKGGELFNRVVEDNFVLTEAAAAVIICQLCEAIDYIHCQSIVHLDIKPENIMCVTESGNRIKLIDFGLARQYDGTPEFSAPEVIKCDPLDFHTDMWSVGVITYILLSGYSPFLGETTPITWVNVERGEWDFIEEFDCVSEEAKDFISKLLIYDKSLRMLPKECLAHPWLASVRERAQKDALLDQPNVGPPISTANLKRYNIRRRFRKATYAVMSYCEFSQILGALRKRNSNGLAIIKKPRSITRKKKIPLVEAVLAAQNAEQNNSTPLEPMQLQPPKEERITLKTESSDSTKENKQIPTVVIGDSAENVAPVEAVVRKKKIVRKKKPIREQPARTTELDILRTQVDGSAPSESMLKKIKQTDETIAEVSPPERPKRRSVKKSVEEITEKVACEKPSTSENSILKTSLGKDLKNVEPKTDGKVPSPSSSSRSSAPKVRVNSLIAERLKNLQSDSVPLTFSISGKKFEPAKSLSATSEKSEAPKKGFKELSLVTEKKSTTTTTTQVKSKVENTERKFTTRTADKNIEETIEKRSTQQQVKVTQTTIAEEKCPETGVPRKTVQKNITKKQQQDKEVEKSRREEVLGMDKTTVKTMRSLHKELNDKATVEKKTKACTSTDYYFTQIDGETKDDKKMELQTIRLRKIDGRATQKSSFQDMQVTVSSKTKSGIRCKDGSREEEENRQSQMEAKINAKKSSTSEASSLLRELSRLKKTRPEEPELKSALRREGSTGEKKSVKLSEIILPRIRIDDDRGSAKVKFAESTHMAPLPSLPGVSGGGLQRNKSESNVAAKVKSSLSSTAPPKPPRHHPANPINRAAESRTAFRRIKQKTVDDSGIRRKQHWLEADIEADLRPKEDFSFSSLKEKLERRVLGDPFIDARPPKETIKIPGASNAFAKWKKLEGAR